MATEAIKPKALQVGNYQEGPPEQTFAGEQAGEQASFILPQAAGLVNHIFVSAARAYLRRGFALLPLLPGDKRPHADVLKAAYGRTEWKPLRDNPATEQDVLKWFDIDPAANIGIITGEPSGGLALADFDVNPIPEHLELPRTPSVYTGRGQHLYFQAPGAKTRDIVDGGGQKLGEIKAEGGYVCAPPSLHESGRTYTWRPDFGLFDLPLATLPDWLFKPSSKGEIQGATSIHMNTHGTSGEDLSTGVGLTSFFMIPEVVSAVAARLGIPAAAAEPGGIGKGFHCVLPGHRDGRPSAGLHCMESGITMYHDFHAGPYRERGADPAGRPCWIERPGREWWCLPDVYASQCYAFPAQDKLPVMLKAPERAVWLIRLLVEVGAVKPATVRMLPLPRGAKESEKKLYAGLRLLFGCRWLYSPGDPAPFGWDFAQAWCGIGSHHTVRDAMKQLMGRGIIRIAAQDSRGRNLFLPGQGESRQQKGDEGRDGETRCHQET